MPFCARCSFDDTCSALSVSIGDAALRRRTGKSKYFALQFLWPLNFSTARDGQWTKLD
jgi:hypothetical protein